MASEYTFEVGRGRCLRPCPALVLGGASMGSASAIYAAAHAAADAATAVAAAAAAADDAEVAGSTPAPATGVGGAQATSAPVISGLVLVILPTFYDERTKRKSQILAGAERGYEHMVGPGG